MARPAATGPGAAGRAGGEWSGYLAGQLRWFPHTNAPVDWHAGLSLAAEPEYYRVWDGGSQSLTFRPFLRLDQRDPSRTHADLRELLWIRSGAGWELRAGVGKAFWGVTESVHLVDIINQTDLVENPDGEQKLGQPMLKLSLERDWGIWDLFLLPGFRERTFPGSEGRLGPRPTVDTGAAIYESGAAGRRTPGPGGRPRAGRLRLLGPERRRGRFDRWLPMGPGWRRAV